MRSDQLAERVRELLGADPRVLTVYLFGSRAKGTERPDSDVDLGVLFAETPPARLDGSLQKLESLNHLVDFEGFLAAVRTRLERIR